MRILIALKRTVLDGALLWIVIGGVAAVFGVGLPQLVLAADGSGSDAMQVFCHGSRVFGLAFIGFGLVLALRTFRSVLLEIDCAPSKKRPPSSSKEVSVGS